MASARYTRNIRPEDIIPDEPIQYTRAQRAANWWHYHKWYVLAALAALALVVYGLHETVFAPEPDCQFTLVLDHPVPEELFETLPRQLETLAADENGDGQVLVRVDLYQISLGDNESVMDAYAAFAGETMLSTDLDQATSLIFLTDRPEVLTAWSEDIPWPEDKVAPDFAASGAPVPWAETAGAALDLGTYYNPVEGAERPVQEVLAGLSLLRRTQVAEGQPGGSSLWAALTEAP